jgi:type VI secretion system protein ImpM
MSDTATPVRISYFGKIPSRGDFIKASDSLTPIQVLDEWLAETMDLLSEDPRWKIGYDEAKPLDFAFLGLRKKHAIAGHIIPSSDAAQRRFPFLSLSTMEIEEPHDFVSTSPIILSCLWNHLAVQGTTIVAAEDPIPHLLSLSSVPMMLELQSENYQASFKEFLEVQTIGTLSKLLLQAGFKGNVRQSMIALGLLLQPVLTSSNAYLEKSLTLPLPSDPLYRNFVGAFWMHMVTPFLSRTDLELAMFFTHIKQQPTMILGFSGASAQTLQAILDPQLGWDRHVSLEDAEWVDDHVNEDYSLKKLSSYLVQPDLSLKSSLELFRSTFIGT